MGAFAYDQLPELKPHQCCIVNEGSSKTDGFHWMALIRIDNTYYLYDSFGRDVKKIFPRIKYFKNKKVVNSDITHDREQQDKSLKNDKITEINCGQRCLAYLLFILHNGFQKARLI